MKADGGKMTPEKIQAELEICEAATTGPWEFDPKHEMFMGTACALNTPERTIVLGRDFYSKDKEELYALGEFFVHSRSGYPDALRELKEAQEELIEEKATSAGWLKQSTEARVALSRSMELLEQSERKLVEARKIVEKCIRLFADIRGSEIPGKAPKSKILEELRKILGDALGAV